MSKHEIQAEELDKLVDEGKDDALAFFDISTARRINEKLQRVNLDLPVWMVRQLGQEAAHCGVSRQALIKVWLAERLQL